ncbi:hypothetical protein BDN70DRAFT_876156 [Pholiota conissans]|uniref:Calcineurin-like phosphoesterase domain-containing protein n=1 Tax=Pholiota conissans TaxID=109636 RepID=A0A9P5Z505_9AGAR|nr:hypothetical protein BDN70DRAFT_876156 [Pholiota conissans]
MSKPFVTGTTRGQIYSYSNVSTALRLVWVFIVVWGELGIFYWSLSGCHWPSFEVSANLRTTHVLLIADAQIRHPGLLGNRGYGIINTFRRVLYEVNLRKTWHVASNLNPHAVIFLGDMLADGKTSRSAEEYEMAVKKFKSIFEIDEDEEVHYIPGNEDVGLGSVPSISNVLRSYYANNFGPLNTKFVIANHTFIGLDAPGLVDEDYQRHASRVSFNEWTPIPNGPISFVKEISEYHLSHTILLSHIPLSRSETSDCGPHRERGGIRRGAGPGYQSMLGKQTTSFLLHSLEPLAVFSADNRDYCDYTHVLPGARQYSSNPTNSIREVTVKSFSMSSHIRRPGFQLLSLVDPAKLGNSRSRTWADSPCLLPDQDRIYTSLYLSSLVFTLLVMVVLRVRGQRRKPLRDLAVLTPSPRSSGRNTPAVLIETDPAQFSATWSPFSPFIPTSPRPALPSHIRTPRSASNSTTHLVASLPGSPAPSSPSTLLVPMPYSEDDDGEDNDTMYPAQYAMRRDSYSFHQKEDDEWSNIQDEVYFDTVHDSESVSQSVLLSTSHQSEFVSTPHRSRHAMALKKRTWSYTFVLKGRRRRISISLPSWSSLNNLLDFLGLGSETSLSARKRQSNVLLSVLSVLWPALVAWVIINWMIL